MLLRSGISDFFHPVWNSLKKSGEILGLNPSREFGEEVEIIHMLMSVTLLFL